MIHIGNFNPPPDSFAVEKFVNVYNNYSDFMTMKQKSSRTLYDK